MKKILTKKLLAISVVFIIFLGVLIVPSVSPYIYTKMYGNAETEKLYTAYEMAKNTASLKHIQEYLHNNNIEYVEHKKDGIIALHADTEGHSETVLIWHMKGVTTGARFDDFL